MPIRPEMRDKYPANWPEIRADILKRARYRCEEEGCGVHEHAIGWRDEEGTFCTPQGGGDESDAAGEGLDWDTKQRLTYARAKQIVENSNAMEEGRRRPRRWIFIVLTVAHLNHDPTDCKPENLKALCQLHHLRYDGAHHAQTAARTRRSRKAMRDLFEEAVSA